MIVDANCYNEFGGNMKITESLFYYPENSMLDANTYIIKDQINIIVDVVAGDHILFDITPNITLWPGVKNSLKDYLASLEKVYPLDVNLVLPGHRSIMKDHRKRIRELKKHHQERLDEVLIALKDGAKSAFQVAPYITWDIKYKSWELFPAQQKWFAFGETFAHLKYLEEEGIIRRETQGDKTVFLLK
jgi:glyoxylase-like metal-dependent hydrolase (beta-lactamase superfamily II)